MGKEKIQGRKVYDITCSALSTRNKLEIIDIKESEGSPRWAAPQAIVLLHFLPVRL